MESPIGTTIAINGPWGSGKSSALNLVRHHLQPECQAGRLEIIDFRSWWFRGEEALTLAFLQELNAALRETLGDKAKEILPKLGKTLLQAGPVVGATVNIATAGVWGALTGGSFDFVKRFFPEGENVEKLFRRLSEALEKQNKRFLVLIDDIDRLTPDEALLVFRLIKSVGRLPRLMYLLAFDRELAEKAVKERYPSEGPHFLEKIIQASFELPLPPRDDLNAAALSLIEKTCGLPPGEKQLLRLMNTFYDAVAPHVRVPRDLTRLSNAMAISWPPVAGEVNIADYVALETMRLFEPLLYNAIRSSKDRVCGLSGDFGDGHSSEQELQKFLDLVPEKRREVAKVTLMRLFPRFENVGYSNGFLNQWDAERLACVEKHFDAYFRMTLGDEALSVNEIDTFIARCDDKTYVKEAFLEALRSIRKNGKSKVPLLLDELNAHGSRIEKTKFRSLLSALFEIADDIDRREDYEQAAFTASSYLQLHWLIRKLTFQRCDLDERSEILLAACENAQIGWLADFTSSAVSDHFPKKGEEPEPPEKCLVKLDYIGPLKERTVNTIEAAARAGDLLHHPELAYVLYRWRDLSDDNGSAVKAWVDGQLGNDLAVARFAKVFTTHSWSQGMGGLGDRVAMRQIRAGVSGLDSIMDVGTFRVRLEALVASGTLESPEKGNVETFLKAWREKDQKRHEDF
jgi:predicted KAP-like P-loop ATPase